jgi:hypothetical protein
VNRIRLIVLGMACSIFGCVKAPPSPVIVPVTGENYHCHIAESSLNCLKWPAGNAVVVWTDIKGFCGGGSGPCPEGVVYAWSIREQVTRKKPNYQEFPPGVPQPPQPPRPPGPPAYTTTTEETNRNVNWRCETADGLSGRVTINEKVFDLTNGNLFLVSTALGGSVTQLSRDFSGLKPIREAFAELAKTDEPIRKFVEAAIPTP